MNFAKAKIILILAVALFQVLFASATAYAKATPTTAKATSQTLFGGESRDQEISDSKPVPVLPPRPVPKSAIPSAPSTQKPSVKHSSRPTSHARHVPSGSPRSIAAQIAPSGQLGCFDSVISRESSWNVHAVNPSSGAYGLGQALPGSKMSSAGSDWTNNPLTQLRWALSYMDSRYGSPCGAAAHESAYGWY